MTLRGAMMWPLAATLLLAAGARTAEAQRDSGGRDRVSERVAGARPMMDRLSEMVQRKLRLSDDQARQLRDATGQFATQRHQLLRQERTLRRELRDELARGETARQDRVAALLDNLLGLQRQRADLVSAEQRALSRFMTPVQRAEFLAMQERAFRAAQQMRQQREGRPGGGARPVY